MIKKITATALIAASLTTSAIAFEQQGAKKGNSVVGMDVRYNSMSIETAGTTTTNTNTNINVSYSQFLTDSIELGAYLGSSLSSSDTAGSTDTTSQNVGIMANYNFSSVSPTLVPYVGINGSMYTMDNGGTKTDENGYGAEAGLKIFVSEKASIVPAAYYQKLGESLTQTGAKVAVQFYF